MNPQGWYSSSRQLLGALKFQIDKVQAYPLKFQPFQTLDYNEVLVYVTVSGGGIPIHGYYRVHAQDQYGVYEQYVDLKLPQTPAFSYSSANIWLPLTYEKMVYATYRGSDTNGKFEGNLYVIAYR